MEPKEHGRVLSWLAVGPVETMEMEHIWRPTAMEPTERPLSFLGLGTTRMTLKAKKTHIQKPERHSEDSGPGRHLETSEPGADCRTDAVSSRLVLRLTN